MKTTGLVTERHPQKSLWKVTSSLLKSSEEHFFEEGKSNFTEAEVAGSQLKDLRCVCFTLKKY